MIYSSRHLYSSESLTTDKNAEYIAIESTDASSIQRGSAGPSMTPVGWDFEIGVGFSDPDPPGVEVSMSYGSTWGAKS